MSADHCTGCDIPSERRVNLPEGWEPGQPMPDNLTIHSTQRDPRRFAFIGNLHAQLRHYISEQ